MTLLDVFNIDFPSEFGMDDDGEMTGSYCDIINQLPKDVEVKTGASKFVIFLNDYEVAKIPFNGYWTERWNAETDEYDEDLVFEYYNTTDYCAIEADIYKNAIAAGVELFFASTKFAGMTKDNTPYYISERVYDFYDDNYEIRTPSKDSRKKAEQAKDIFDSELDEVWLALAYEWYGDAAVQQLLNFIKEEHISDLHSGNIGFRKNGAPVILDYSSFDE